MYNSNSHFTYRKSLLSLFTSHTNHELQKKKQKQDGLFLPQPSSAEETGAHFKKVGLKNKNL